MTAPEIEEKALMYKARGYDFNLWLSSHSLDGTQPRYSYATMYKSKIIHSSDLFKTTQEAWEEALEIAEDHSKDA